MSAKRKSEFEKWTLKHFGTQLLHPDTLARYKAAFNAGRRAERRGKTGPDILFDIRALAMCIAEYMTGVNDHRAIKAKRTAKVIRAIAEQEFLKAGGNRNELFAKVPAERRGKKQ